MTLAAVLQAAPAWASSQPWRPQCAGHPGVALAWQQVHHQEVAPTAAAVCAAAPCRPWSWAAWWGAKGAPTLASQPPWQMSQPTHGDGVSVPRRPPTAATAAAAKCHRVGPTVLPRQPRPWTRRVWCRVMHTSHHSSPRAPLSLCSCARNCVNAIPFLRWVVLAQHSVAATVTRHGQKAGRTRHSHGVAGSVP